MLILEDNKWVKKWLLNIIIYSDCSLLVCSVGVKWVFMVRCLWIENLN